jgi:DNA-directed RNA polymerase subunit RPC12/RpoP
VYVNKRAGKGEIKMLPIIQEELLYVIEVFGEAPEFWANSAFRIQGSKGFREEHERQKEIKCPHCGNLFMVVSVKRRLDLVRLTRRVKTACHESRDCRKCHEKIGIVYLPESNQRQSVSA